MKMIQRITALITSVCLIFTMCGATAFAQTSTQKEQRASDGTLILKEYPVDKQLEALKVKMVETMYMQKSGTASQEDANAAAKAFYLYQGDVNSANNVGKETVMSEEEIATIKKVKDEQLGVQISAAVRITGISTLLQYPQETSYYCGPSTAKSLLGAQDIVMSQADLAADDQLQTDSWGQTPWYVDSTTEYIMANVLNNNIDRNWYVAKPAPSASTLYQYVKGDVSSGYGVAASMNFNSTTTNRPAGYPIKAMGHWIALEGYGDDGTTIRYAEPIYNATAVSWYKNITKRYPTASSANLATWVSTRGIIW